MQNPQSIIKFLPLFAKCIIQWVSDFYTLQSLNTCVDSAINLLVQFHHINDMQGGKGCMCVSCAKNLLVKFDPVKMLPSKHRGVAYMQLSCIDGTQEVNYMAQCRSVSKEALSD